MILNRQILKKLENYIESINIEDSKKTNSKKLEIPVCCEENFSLDIKTI